MAGCGGSKSDKSGDGSGAVAVTPVVSLSASTSTVTAGQPVTLTWTSGNATACTATGPWSGTQALNGSTQVVPASAGHFDYTLSCSGAGGSASQSASITVAPASGGSTPPAAPTVSINLSSPALVVGQSATLNWSASSATACVASGAWNGAEGSSGSLSITPAATGSMVYALNCSGPGGNTAASTQLTVASSGSGSTAPAVALTLAPATIVAGQSSTLSWVASNVSTCTASGSWSGSMGLSGSQLISPTAAGNHVYTLSCTGPAGPASNSATLTVVNAYSLGGTVAGLAHSGLVLTDGYDAALPLATSAGTFTFPTLLSPGTPYKVTVEAQPAGLNCGLSNASGTMGNANIGNVGVSCATASYSVGGSVAGLANSGLVLQDNAADNLTVATGSTSFKFATQVANAGAYAVTIKTQPAHAVCVVGSGSGKISGSNISNVSLNCATQYAYVSNYGDGTLSQFIIAADGHLVPMATATVSTGSGPSSLVIEHSASYAYVASKGSANVSQFAIDVLGNLSAMSTASVAAGQYPSNIVADPTGKYVFVANKGSGTVSQFSVGSGGALNAQSAASVSAGVQPYRINLTADGKFAYVANLQGNLSQYSLGATGTLNPLSSAQFAAGQWPLAVTTDATSKFAYVLDSGQCETCGDGSIGQYSIATGGNLLPLATATVSAGSWPTAMVLSPNGKYAYVVNYGDNTVSQYAVGADGSLSLLTPATIATGNNPVSMVVDNSGSYAYVVNSGDNSVSEYTIASGGLLSPMPTATIAVGSNPSAMVIGGIR
jgi:6-phosphogluconolactonase (cycloisomerase 2 family)